MNKFCTCNEVNCKLHPTNHNEGCNLCIKKNLSTKEIPACFFHLISDDVENMTDFSFEKFAQIVLKQRQ